MKRYLICAIERQGTGENHLYFEVEVPPAPEGLDEWSVINERVKELLREAAQSGAPEVRRIAELLLQEGYWWRVVREIYGSELAKVYLISYYERGELPLLRLKNAVDTGNRAQLLEETYWCLRLAHCAKFHPQQCALKSPFAAELLRQVDWGKVSEELQRLDEVAPRAVEEALKWAGLL